MYSLRLYLVVGPVFIYSIGPNVHFSSVIQIHFENIEMLELFKRSKLQLVVEY